MGYGIKFRVFGDYACFTRPEMKAERVSYDCMTPSAARGIIESIYWKPAIVWIIDKIHVLNEVSFTSIRRNEVSENIKFSNVKNAMSGKSNIETSATENRQQRATLALKNVNYIIEAHFELTDKAGSEDNIEKHYNIALRRLRKGQCFERPFLGTREFGASFEIVEDEPQKSSLTGTMNLGYMLYDIEYTMSENKNKKESDYNISTNAMFFKAELNNGIMDLTNVKVVK